MEKAEIGNEEIQKQKLNLLWKFSNGRYGKFSNNAIFIDICQND